MRTLCGQQTGRRTQRPVQALAALVLAAGPAPIAPVSANAPAIVARTAMSAKPDAYAQGSSGPINRMAFDLVNFPPGAANPTVACVYPRAFAYRCGFTFVSDPGGGERRRVIVEIPDLARGTSIAVQFRNDWGQAEARVELVNRPQVIHEIESVVLANGGSAGVDGSGRPAPSTQLVSERATTEPAIAETSLGAPPTCERVYAQWVGVGATDPVFTSAFGALNGSVVIARPVVPGSNVRPNNLPQWLITYPRAATRAQFIAHYEVVYRVGECAASVLRS